MLDRDFRYLNRYSGVKKFGQPSKYKLIVSSSTLSSSTVQVVSLKLTKIHRVAQHCASWLIKTYQMYFVSHCLDVMINNTSWILIHGHLSNLHTSNYAVIREKKPIHGYLLKFYLLPPKEVAPFFSLHLILSFFFPSSALSLFFPASVTGWAYSPKSPERNIILSPVLQPYAPSPMLW